MNAIILSLISWFIFLINPPIGLGSLAVLIETGLYGLMEYRIKRLMIQKKTHSIMLILYYL